MPHNFLIRLKYAPLLMACLACLQCTPKPTLQHLEGITQGTQYHIQFWRTPAFTAAEQAALQAGIHSQLDTIDAQFSNYRPDSVVEHFNQHQALTPFSVPAEFTQLLQIAINVGQRSQGCYDLTIGPVFKAWGFYNDTFTLPSETTLKDALSKVGLDKIRLLDATHLVKTQPSVALDFGSIGQGYTVGELAKHLEALGIQHYIVEIGGEMQVKGHKPDGQAWRIALDKPLPNSQRLQKMLSLHSPEATAIMTTGSYRHFFDKNGVKYSHIIDARTGYPIRHNTVSVTVMHPNATLADAWDTALLCLGREEGLKLANEFHLAVLFIDQTAQGLAEYPSQAWGQQAGLNVANP